MTEQRPLLVISNIILDDICLADGSEHPAQLGGAAVYAAAGAAFWWPKIGIVAGVGADLHERTHGSLDAFGFLPHGLLQRDSYTISSRLVYAHDGSRTETPIHGDDHFQRLQVTAYDIPNEMLPAAATYIFRGVDQGFWASVQKRRESLGRILWELEDSAAHESLWPEVAKLLSLVDIISLNLAEASGLLGVTSVTEMVRQMLSAGARTVVLRMGADGALVADQQAWIRLHPASSTVVDVTGGGNGFSGGFLAACQSEPEDIEHAARCAAASAARCLGQFGPPNPQDRSGIDELALSVRLHHLFDSRPLNGRKAPE